MLALSRHGSVPGWWQDYGDAVPAWVKPYLGLEQAATLIRSYDVQFISGLLQTPGYARTVFSLPGAHPSEPSGSSRCGCGARRSCTAPTRRTYGP
jgi:Domain of unknown function (DUF5753)